jgi:hypothetical protein
VKDADVQSFFGEMPAFFANSEIEHVRIDRGIVDHQCRWSLCVAANRYQHGKYNKEKKSRDFHKQSFSMAYNPRLRAIANHGDRAPWRWFN